MMALTSREQKRFNLFRQDVLKYSEIDVTELWIIIRRHTQGWMGRRFFNEDAKVKYYKYWIKLLEGQGILTPINQIGNWKVNA